MPSAVMVAFISAPNVTTAEAKARSAGSSWMPAISERSSLMISGASRRMCLNDA
jgi:hypothetical protein